MKVASFESLEFLLSPSRENYHVIGLKNGLAEGLITTNYKNHQIIFVEPLGKKSIAQQKHFSLWADEKKQIQQTNLNAILKKKGINIVVPDTRTSPFLEKWAAENEIKLVSTSHKFQKQFENKIFFDKFLHKHQLPVPKSWILKSEKDIDKVDVFPVIVQIPESDGSLGTFLKHNKNEIIKLLSEPKIKFPLLCREFIANGFPLGASVLIGPKKMIFSAIRMQAYFSHPSGKSIYYGIQWLKTSFFPPHIIKTINKILLKAGKEMQKIGFRGLAAFDLIMRDDDIYFIECNPRTGGSTPHMSFRKELFHGRIFTDEFIRATCGKELSVSKPFIPHSNYEGFCLDCGFMVYYLPKDTKINSLPNGVFKFEKGKLNYISSHIDEFVENKELIFINYVREEGTLLSSTNFIGFLITHFPLLKIKEGKYNFSVESQILLRHIEGLVVKK